MRLNPEYEENECSKKIEQKTISISSFSDLPEEQQKEIEQIIGTIEKMIEGERMKNPQRDPIITYLALLSLQMNYKTDDITACFKNSKLFADGLDKAYNALREFGADL